MKNQLYGARFKSWAGGSGIAQNITWRDIRLENVPFPIYVTQNYWDQNVSFQAQFGFDAEFANCAW
jgi:hypothetical protein